ncbi:MAG: hypothetical protein PHV37_04190 [Candidatus Gastranaerophilales bacterium]|nr:hypothetical protein [Candidatus Gastranaerophilales bacterium]
MNISSTTPALMTNYVSRPKFKGEQSTKQSSETSKKSFELSDFQKSVLKIASIAVPLFIFGTRFIQSCIRKNLNVGMIEKPVEPKKITQKIIDKIEKSSYKILTA